MRRYVSTYEVWVRHGEESRQVMDFHLFGVPENSVVLDLLEQPYLVSNQRVNLENLHYGKYLEVTSTRVFSGGVGFSPSSHSESRRIKLDEEQFKSIIGSIGVGEDLNGAEVITIR